MSGPAATRTEILAPDAWPAIATDWDALLARAPDALPHLARGWVEAELRRTGRGADARLLVARAGGAPVALLPIVLERRAGITVASAVANDHPGYPGVLADPAAPHAVDALAQAIRRSRVCDVLIAENVSARDEATIRLLRALDRREFHVHAVERTTCWWMTLAPTLEAYLERAQSARTRKKTRQHERNLHRAGAVEIERYRGTAIDDALLRRCASVQADSWLERRGAAVFGDPAWRRFVIDLAEADLARLWMLRFDGEDAAFAIASATAQHMVYEWIAFRLCHEPRRVGKLLTRAVLEDACAGGIATFDFSHGDGEYKRFWGTDQHAVHRVAAGRGLTGRAVARACAEAWRLGRRPGVRGSYRRLRRLAGGARRAA